MLTPILGLSFIWKFIAVLWVAMAVILILVVLIQKGRGSGLGGAFGAGGSMNSLLGTKTGDFFTWATIVLVAVFLILAVLLGIMAAGEKSSPSIQPPAGQQAPQQLPEDIKQAAPIEQTESTEDLNNIETKLQETLQDAENAVKSLEKDANLPNSVK